MNLAGHATAYLVGLASVFTAVYVLGRAVSGVYRVVRTLDDIYHELVPNQGQSLRDAIDRIEQRVDVLEARSCDADSTGAGQSPKSS